MENTLYKRGQLIDLHIHTQYSDGMYTVPELLKYAQKRGLEVISFTDHDLLSANYEVRSLNRQNGFTGKYINGCEISVSFKNKKYEVLAYDFDLDTLAQFEALNIDYQFAIEEQRLEKLKDLGIKLGFKVTPNLKFDPKHRTAHKTFFHDLGKYPANKAVYEEYGIEKSNNLYREHMAKPGSLFHCYDIVTETPSIDYVCKKIHQAGGKAIFAHPFYVYNEADPKGLIKDLASLHILDGFESIHKKFTLEECLWVQRFCLENDLIPTAGTDFHGDGFKIDGVAFAPECLGYVKYAQIETRLPIIKTYEVEK